MLRENIRNPSTLLLCLNPLRSEGYPDNKSLVNYEAGHEDDNKFGKYLFCDVIKPDDSHISDGMLCKSEGNILSGRHNDPKPGAPSINADFSNDSLLCNDIQKKIEENISEESNLDVISDIIYPHDALAP
ncbi:unnamed protein product [Schistosoma margrebowiei]|uniref:Uncharacterized protein n=1 Tax=Schistosoma margrebowiei TaxID=48269 RepID=A0A183MBD4_9TREM|nr:unnamed protein product [Schistosoma margrebowiei]